MNFSFLHLETAKLGPAKDHGKKFQSRLATFLEESSTRFQLPVKQPNNKIFQFLGL